MRNGEKMALICGCCLNGGQGRNRTADASLFRAALYQLSYLATGANALSVKGCCTRIITSEMQPIAPAPDVHGMAGMKSAGESSRKDPPAANNHTAVIHDAAGAIRTQSVLRPTASRC